MVRIFGVAVGSALLLASCNLPQTQQAGEDRAIPDPVVEEASDAPGQPNVMLDICLRSGAQMAFDTCTQALESGRLSEAERVDALLSRGSALLHWRQNPELALKDFNAALALDPEFGDIYRSRGEAYLAQGNHDRAIENFSKAREINDLDLGAIFRLGDVLYRMERYAEAEREYMRARELRPQLPFTHYILGEINVHLHQNYESIPHFNEAIRLDPVNPKAYLFRGIAYLETRQLDLALADLLKSVEQAPRDANAHRILGIVQYKKGAYDDALLSLDRSLDLSRELDATFLYRGRVLVALGYYRQAIEDFKLGLRRDPDATSFKLELALTLAAYKEVFDADRADDLIQSIPNDQSSSTVWRQKAWVLTLIGKTDEAVESYRQSFDSGDRSNFRIASWLNQNGYPDATIAWTRRTSTAVKNCAESGCLILWSQHRPAPDHDMN